MSDNDVLKQVKEMVDNESEFNLADMYDITPEAGEDGLYGLGLNDGLTKEELELAKIYAPLSRGMMIVCGQPGMGKGVFAAHLAWQLRRMFKNKRVLLDYKPKPLFDLGRDLDRYVFFDDEFLLNQMKNIAIESGVKIDDEEEKTSKKNKKNTEEVAKKVLEKNKTLLQNGIWEMDEFKRYMYNRRPTAMINMQTGMIISFWRHLDLLILGMCPNIDEIDYNACQYYLTHIIKMSAASDGHRFFADYYKKQHVTSNGVVNVQGRTQRITVDGDKPHAEIGVELIDSSKAQGNIEKQIVLYLREKYYDDIRNGLMTRGKYTTLKTEENRLIKEYTNFIESYKNAHSGELTIGMSNLNIIHSNICGDLDELNERLTFMHKLGIIKCKRFYDLFNSKNKQDLRFR